MAFSLTSRDRAALDGVHPDLVAVVERAARLTPVPFRVFEGTRTIERQRAYVRRGVSKTMNSRHIPGANGHGHAVDLVLAFDVDGDGDVDGADFWASPGSPSGAAAWRRLETAVKTAARDLGVPVEWGGDWRSFKDYPHWQLPWSAYPAERPLTQEARRADGATGTQENAYDGIYSPGDSGEAVRRCQKTLRRLGYVIPVSGTMDERTVFVIRVVQRQNGLEIDGVLGPRTMTAIDAMAAAAARGEPAGAEQANADLEVAEAAPRVDEPTDQSAARTRAAVVGGGGAVAGAGLIGEGIDQALEAVRHGEGTVAPGTVLHAVFGLAVVALLGFQAYRMLRRAGALPSWFGGTASGTRTS
ncbi:peptidoglycan-binding protein [Amorphus orientalis]|uniref:Peptidoglycan binding-like domain-containing protein n=1 Tax=Amorphus orientalis TaxID=649198 RepID=A0AAE3VSW9_9HYPH|nr:peptidoglycan-binding protein [Amorphus orientalis]MDQ0317824.1 hypothetical protein [Amorphus orientalis]